MGRAVLLVALLCACGPIRLVGADTFVLKNGGRIEGALAGSEKGGEKGGEKGSAAKGAPYRVKTSLGLVTLRADQIERVVAEAPGEKLYRQYLLKMPETADGHWKMAEWCRANELAALRLEHLEKAIVIDPDHEAARRALGYNKTDDGWRRVDEFMLKKGYVRHKGAWRLPQEILLATQAEEIDARQKEWRKRLKMWRGWIGSKRGNEGLENIRTVDDPLAALALADLLLSEKDREVKLLFVDVLARVPSPTAVGALIQASLYDADEMVRDACLTKLSERGTGQAVAAYCKVLKGVGERSVDVAENTQINRAGEGLGRMKDPHSVKTLIDGLITKYRVVVQPSSGNVGATFGGSGGGGLSAGNKPHVEIHKVGNKTVLDALSVITGENFGFNPDQWKAWYAEDRTPDAVDLRRGGL